MPSSTTATKSGGKLQTSSPLVKKQRTGSKPGAKPTDSSQDSTQSVKSVKTKFKLSLLPSLSLDVLFEIFGHLHPLDILNLSRLTRAFRGMLMRRSATSIWKAALREVGGLPPCPPDMSFPFYVNLMFSQHCHNCLTARVQRVDYVLRVRLCEACIRTPGVLDTDNDLNMEANATDQAILACVAFSSAFRIPKKKGLCCLPQERKAFVSGLGLRHTAAERSAYVDDREQALQSRKHFAIACEQWAESMSHQRWDQLQGIRDQRRTDISEKLASLGFTEELEYAEGINYLTLPPLDQFADHPDVKVNKPLTDRAWKTIEPRVVAYMEKVRTHRLDAERLQVVRKREEMAVEAWAAFRSQSPAERLLPSGIEIISWPIVKDVLELPSSIPMQTDEIVCREESSEITAITPGTFTRIFSSSSGLIDDWASDKLEKLNRLNVAVKYDFVRGYGRVLSTALDDLQLAISVFSCEDKCALHYFLPPYDAGAYPVMWYPECLHHPCNTATIRRPRAEEDLPENPLYKASDGFFGRRRRTWTCKNLFLNEKASKAVERLLDACSLSRYTTTAKLDELDERFICLKCSFGTKCDGQMPRLVMSWRMAVQHCMKVHWGDGSVNWERLSEESTREARSLSAAKAVIQEKFWRCALCRFSPGERSSWASPDDVKQHIARQVISVA
ncbi:unnamed protein product [Mycena citricolor]|uniref:F-box domain-containing protein n=1 Tax=Mycena citricolor TaxID=2018698 RepID=A0AAD2GUV3_9AGAR|nr:unnamed protein product [Mycena citricolor]